MHMPHMIKYRLTAEIVALIVTVLFMLGFSMPLIENETDYITQIIEVISLLIVVALAGVIIVLDYGIIRDME